MSERLVVTAFITGNDGKKRPQRIGTVVMKSADKGSLYLTAMPVGAWDGSAAIEVPRERDDQPRGGSGSSYGTSGYGANAKHTGTPDDDSGMPF